MNISQTPGFPKDLSQVLFEPHNMLETNWYWDLPAFVHPFSLLKYRPDWFEVALNKLVQLWQYSQKSSSWDIEAKMLFTFPEPPVNYPPLLAGGL